MAIEIKFKCNREKEDSLQVYSNLGGEDVIIKVEVVGMEQEIYLDITTAIKFAKTIRTEINKIKEVSNV
jgi:hypothetical protein|tara:strand:- start:2900 stop:3106 length:207 start_codon:yes stop_codon:yes gene_type:complete